MAEEVPVGMKEVLSCLRRKHELNYISSLQATVFFFFKEGESTALILNETNVLRMGHCGASGAGLGRALEPAGTRPGGDFFWGISPGGRGWEGVM